MTPLSVPLKTSVTSRTSPTDASSSEKLVPNRDEFGLSSDLVAHDVVDVVEALDALLISTRAPSSIETLTSWRIVPSPRLTFPVERSNIPIRSAASRACSGLEMSGLVPISTSGIPSRSRL